MKKLINKLNVWWNGDYSHNTHTSYSRQTQRSQIEADGLAYEGSAKYKLWRILKCQK